MFRVDSKTGLIFQKLPLKSQLYSFEVKFEFVTILAFYILYFQIFVNEGSLKQQKALVEILASNQTGPSFSKWKDIKIEIEENSLEAKEVFNFQTYLNDVITTKNFTFHLKSINKKQKVPKKLKFDEFSAKNRKFEIESGRLCLKDTLDREEEENIILII